MASQEIAELMWLIRRCLGTPLSHVPEFLPGVVQAVRARPCHCPQMCAHPSELDLGGTRQANIVGYVYQKKHSLAWLICSFAATQVRSAPAKEKAGVTGLALIPEVATRIPRMFHL